MKLLRQIHYTSLLGEANIYLGIRDKLFLAQFNVEESLPDGIHLDIVLDNSNEARSRVFVSCYSGPHLGFQRVVLVPLRWTGYCITCQNLSFQKFSSIQSLKKLPPTTILIMLAWHKTCLFKMELMHKDLI